MPTEVNWQDVKFGVEIEFVEGRPESLALPQGWKLLHNERQIDQNGEESGAEATSPHLSWHERNQIAEALSLIEANGGMANWSCGLHVHVGLERWGEAIVVPLLKAAIRCQTALRALFQTAEHRDIFCPFVTEEMLAKYIERPTVESLINKGRPLSHRCGVNLAAWFDYGTVEIRFANASLEFERVLAAVELSLKFVAAVGDGRELPDDPEGLAAALGVRAGDCPPPMPAPLWHLERMWLEDWLIPHLAGHAEAEVPGGEILAIRPTRHGLRVDVETPWDQAVTALYVDVDPRRIRRAWIEQERDRRPPSSGR